MSNHLISLSYSRKLPSLICKSVLVLLADKASDDGGGIYASKQTIADELCCSRQGVINAIKQLVDIGLLREVGQRQCANGYTVEYAINVPVLESADLVDAHAARAARRPVNQVDPSMGLTRQPRLRHPSTRFTLTPHEPYPSDATHPSDSARARAEPEKPKPAKAKSPRKAYRPAKALPPDFKPDLTPDAAAMVEAWPVGMLESELAKMRDWAAAKGETAKDWQARFRNWLRSADERWRRDNDRRGPRNAQPIAGDNRPSGPFARHYADELAREAGRAAGQR